MSQNEKLLKYYVLPTILRDAIETIRNEGIPALERMQRDGESLYFDLTIILR